jgi:hypothetical protein
MIVIQLLGIDDKVQLSDDGVWTSTDTLLAEYCDSIAKARPRVGYEPDPVMAEAQYVCHEIGGEILSDSRPDESQADQIPDGAAL